MACELRVFLREDCLINPYPPARAKAARAAAGLLALFVPKLIEMAIGGVATLLKKAGAARATQAAGSDLVDLYVADDKQALQHNPLAGCVLAVCGIFEGGDPSPSDQVLKKLHDAGLVSKTAEVRAIFEAAIRRSADDTAFFLDTRHFSVRELLDGRGERDFLATLTLTTPDVTADGDAIAIGTIDLGRRRRGADVVPQGHPQDTYPRFRSNLMPWRQISEASKAVYDADVAAGTAKGRRYMPVTFTLTLSETDDGNALLVALGELLDGAKAEAATELSKLVLPEKREEAAKARAEAAELLYEEELKAEKAVREAQQKFDTGSAEEKPILAIDLELAKRALARKTALREAAGLPPRPPVPAAPPRTPRPARRR